MLSVHIEQGQVSLRQAPRPRPKPGFALIRLILAGICNTDIELLRGYYGFCGRPGHEFVDIHSLDANGTRRVNYARIHDTRPIRQAASAASP